MSVSPKTSIRSSRNTLLACLVVLLTTAPSLRAQPQVQIAHVETKPTLVHVTFTASCDGTPVFDLNYDNVKLYDRGEDFWYYTLSSPDTATPGPISAVLVFDQLNAQQGAALEALKNGGRSFCSQLDGLNDEAAILSFGTSVLTHQAMTTIKPALDAAVDLLGPAASTAPWDAVYQSIDELDHDAVNPAQAVILFTSGALGPTEHTVQDCIAHASAHGKRVFTVAMGPDVIYTAALDSLARGTGGRAYHTLDSLAVPDIAREIMSLMRHRFGEYHLTFEPRCPPNGDQPLRIVLREFCGDTVSALGMYTIVKDSNWYHQVDFYLRANTPLNGDCRVEIGLDSLLRLPMRRGSLSIRFDTTLLSFVRFSPGMMFDEVPFTVEVIRDTVRITTLEAMTHTQPGWFGALLFHPSTVPRDTVAIVSFAALDMGAPCTRVGMGVYARVPLYPAMSRVEAPAVLRSFDVFPDPNVGAVTVSLVLRTPMNIFITVTDILGRTVYEYRSSEAVSQLTQQVDLHAMTPGVLFLRVSAGHFVWTRKLLRE
jgi:hypothetical protein